MRMWDMIGTAFVMVQMMSCVGAQVRKETGAGAVESEVPGTCSSYSKQCDECLDTLRRAGTRVGVPIADRMSCPACNELDGACKGRGIKLFPWPVPDSKQHEEEAAEESEPKPEGEES